MYPFRRCYFIFAFNIHYLKLDVIYNVILYSCIYYVVVSILY